MPPAMADARQRVQRLHDALQEFLDHSGDLQPPGGPAGGGQAAAAAALRLASDAANLQAAAGAFLQQHCNGSLSSPSASHDAARSVSPAAAPRSSSRGSLPDWAPSPMPKHPGTPAPPAPHGGGSSSSQGMPAASPAPWAFFPMPKAEQVAPGPQAAAPAPAPPQAGAGRRRRPRSWHPQLRAAQYARRRRTQRTRRCGRSRAPAPVPVWRAPHSRLALCQPRPRLLFCAAALQAAHQLQASRRRQQTQPTRGPAARGSAMRHRRRRHTRGSLRLPHPRSRHHAAQSQAARQLGQGASPPQQGQHRRRLPPQLARCAGWTALVKPPSRPCSTAGQPTLLQRQARLHRPGWQRQPSGRWHLPRRQGFRL